MVFQDLESFGDSTARGKTTGGGTDLSGRPDPSMNPRKGETYALT